jgi:N-methylhydantoinase A
LTGIAATPTIRRVKMPSGGNLRDALIKTDGCFFRRAGRLERMNTAFYRRELLPVGQIIEGPAIILQTDTTTVVPPGSTIVADGGGNLIIQLRGAP